MSFDLPHSGSCRITEVVGDHDSVSMVLVSSANHNDIEDVMGSAFYERVGHFVYSVMGKHFHKVSSLKH